MAKKKMVYTIIQGSDREQLIDAVQEYIKNGWLPQGGVSMVDDPKSAFAMYCQAMTKNG